MITDLAKSPTNPSDDHVTQYGWRAVGSLFDIKALLQTTELADAAVGDLANNGLGQCCIFYPENGTVAFELRFYTSNASANETVTLDIYGAAGEDYYTHIGQLTLTVGTGQKGSATILFVDTIAEVLKTWLTTTTPVNPANDTIARWALNAHGYDRFAFCASAATADLDPAVAGTADDTLFIEARRF